MVVSAPGLAGEVVLNERAVDDPALVNHRRAVSERGEGADNPSFPARAEKSKHHRIETNPEQTNYVVGSCC